MEMFELYETYSSAVTSHVGPYLDFEEAVGAACARLRGCRTLQQVDVVPRSAPHLHPKFSLRTVTREDALAPEYQI